ncbi:MAG TPA: hypothetical protein VMK53_06810 [Gemmatimonadales bacterium]|nr:hypothetical protein [Gemmatimonadales bacterium]
MAGRQRASPRAPDPEQAPDAAQRIWLRAVGDSALHAEVAGSADRLSGDLRIGMVRWIGGEAYRALLARALGETRREHPALVGLTCFGDDEAALRAAVRKHGAEAVAAGMVAVLRAMITLLGRIMGDDMAVHLVEQNCSPRHQGERASGAGGGS